MATQVADNVARLVEGTSLRMYKITASGRSNSKEVRPRPTDENFAARVRALVTGSGILDVCRNEELAMNNARKELLSLCFQCTFAAF